MRRRQLSLREYTKSTSRTTAAQSEAKEWFRWKYGVAVRFSCDGWWWWWGQRGFIPYIYVAKVLSLIHMMRNMFKCVPRSHKHSLLHMFYGLAIYWIRELIAINLVGLLCCSNRASVCVCVVCTWMNIRPKLGKALHSSIYVQILYSKS